ncbi:MAG: DUF523 and DUF1722 domain-containing protein [Candidatus Bipolaricaulis sp.]|nr:DUF523 and DUF1722 domain-containing protein [Candidatus Bipolaricaulis sp.]
MTADRPTVLFSRCLGFEACRYNGGIVSAPIVDALRLFVNAVPVCPEVSIGLGVPRAPIRLLGTGDTLRLVQPETGVDVTSLMHAFTDGFLAGAEKLYDGAVLKSGSPSCGIRDAKAYAEAERGSASRRTAGFFGRSVADRLSGSAIEDEGRLRNLDIRQHFLTQLFARARFRTVESRRETRALVLFHSQYKLVLMAYSQVGMRELGRLVANPQRRAASAMIAEYGARFMAALARAPRRGSAVNVLMHALGYVSERLTPREKAFFLTTLEEYRSGRVSLAVPSSLMRSWIVRFEVPYLADQVFFEPYPRGLVDELDSGKGREVR